MPGFDNAATVSQPQKFQHYGWLVKQGPSLIPPTSPFLSTPRTSEGLPPSFLLFLLHPTSSYSSCSALHYQPLF